jgi:hypothetical protein
LDYSKFWPLRLSNCRQRSSFCVSVIVSERGFGSVGSASRARTGHFKLGVFPSKVQKDGSAEAAYMFAAASANAAGVCLLASLEGGRLSRSPASRRCICAPTTERAGLANRPPRRPLWIHCRLDFFWAAKGQRLNCPVSVEYDLVLRTPGGRFLARMTDFLSQIVHCIP